MTVVEHLIDQLASAAIEAPQKGYVAVQPITIGRQTRMCVFQHPSSKVTFPAITIGRQGVLKLGCGLKDTCWDHVRSPVVFRVSLKDSRGHEREVFALTLDVRPGAEGRRWVDRRIDLSEFENQTVTLTFATSVPRNHDASYCWSGWSDPKVEFEASPAPRALRKDRHRHVLLITSDALRADHLGCYGHPLVKTPHLDQLAREGCLFRHARAQTPTTLGSYASVLTGRHAIEHGILAEWGRIKPGISTLPQQLQAHGYHTVIAPSEAEVGEDDHGLVSLFAETIPCLAVPAQSGEITTRQFVRWLDHRLDQPFFAWLQFFDTHPPSTPPEPFRSMYYRGDPTDPARAYDPEAVALIRGVESVIEIEPALEMLSRGQIDAALIERLQATAHVMTGKTEVGPDLVAHLNALGPEARRNLSPQAFGSWLEAEVSKLRTGLVSPELLEWLRHILSLLHKIETEIISWLDGVVDFRYPLAQYMGGVSQVDHQVGQIVAALKERGLYDRTTIVFTSPHGELLGENGMYFHHHVLMEGVLRIPALVKPAIGASRAPGMRIDGVFDQIDILPTLLDAVGVPHPADLAGTSRWRQVCDGSAIPEHDSIAVDHHRTMFALVQPPYVFLKAVAPYFVSTGWQWNAGDRALFELRDPMMYSHNLIEELVGTAGAMEDRLNKWLHRLRPPSKGVKSRALAYLTRVLRPIGTTLRGYS